MAKLFLLLTYLLTFSSDVFAHGISESDRAAMLEGGMLQYVWLGASHMVTGYDHLLFIFGIIFFLTGFRDIVKYVSIFTLGHSLTLIFATIFEITANYYLVDAVIALSVCYKGFDNIDGFNKYLGFKSPHLPSVIFIFGLIHGFGLSTRLQQLPLGDEGLVSRILSFNVGVEIGQIAALIVMISIVKVWRQFASYKKFSLLSNYTLIALGIMLFFMQTHGFMHTRYPDDYGFSKDNHAHIHEEMDRDKPTKSGHDNL